MRKILARSLGGRIRPRTLDLLHQKSIAAHYRANEVIYRQGSQPDGVYFVGHGCVLLEWTAPDGFVAAFRLASGGQCFGQRSFCAYEPRSTVARSITASLTVHVPGAVLERAMDDDPELIRAVACLVARDAGPRISRVTRNGRKRLRARLAYLLAELTQYLQGGTSDEGEYYELPLTHRDLSNLLDATQESVSRALRQLEESGLLAIKHRPRRLLILNRTSLAELVGAVD